MWNNVQKSSIIVLLVRLEIDHGMQFVGCVAEQTLQIAHKSIDISLACSFVDDVLIVVVPKAPTQLLVVHFGFIFSKHCC